MNKKNILFSTVFPLTIAGASLVTALPLSISNNSNVVVKNSSLTANISNNINATDWNGYISGSFTANDYVIDKIERTITYRSTDPSLKTYVAQNLVIPSKIIYENNEYNVIIGYGAFSSYYGVNISGSLRISEGITSIGDYAFFSCSDLVNVDIPNSVTSIGRSSFYGCISLNGALTIKDSVTYLGEKAFYLCCSLTNLTIGNGLTSIEKDTFSQCFLLGGDLTIPGNVKNIGSGAFLECKMISNLLIESDTISIGEYSFNHLDNLKTITTNFSDINNLNIGKHSFEYSWHYGIVCNNNKILSSSAVLEKMQSNGGLYNSWVAEDNDPINISGIFVDNFNWNEGMFFSGVKNHK